MPNVASLLSEQTPMQSATGPGTKLPVAGSTTAWASAGSNRWVVTFQATAKFAPTVDDSVDPNAATASPNSALSMRSLRYCSRCASTSSGRLATFSSTGSPSTM